MMFLMQLAVANLVAARRRTFMLGLALGMVACFLMLLLSLSQGIQDTLIKTGTVLMSGHVNVAGFYKVKESSGAPFIQNVRALRAMVREEISGIDYIVDRRRGWAKLISETGSIQVALAGVRIEDEVKLVHALTPVHSEDEPDLVLTKGSGDVSRLDNPHGIVLFAAQAKRLGVYVGDKLTLTGETLTGSTNTEDVEIVAIVQDLGLLSSWNVFVHQAVIQRLYRLSEDTSGAIHVYLNNPYHSSQIMEQLRQRLIKDGYDLMEHSPQPFFAKFEIVGNEDWTGQKMDLTTWEDELGMLRWSLTALESIAFFLVFILVVIIIVGISNSMMIAVQERTAEIGTMRAIGLLRRSVVGLFVCEGAILGCAASIVGSLIGGILAMIMQAAEIKMNVSALRIILLSDTLHLQVLPQHFLLSIGLFTLVGALAAMMPSYQAAKLPPVLAMSARI